MFGRATIRLGIGPHSSLLLFFDECLILLSRLVLGMSDCCDDEDSLLTGPEGSDIV